MVITPADLLDAQRWRYATRSFDASRPIPADQWQALAEVLVLTPSSYGLQPWTFLGIDTCPIEGFSPADSDRILGLEGADCRSRVVCACGYRSAADRYASLAKLRYPASELIEHR